MLTDADALYRALSSRDPRFDGVFYVGVTSTGIYCRPVCPARTPRPANCRFFSSAEEAESARFRPCRRCRPELAPGNAPVDDARRIAGLLVHRIEEGMLDRPASDGGQWMEKLASQFGWSSRQIRRVVRRELGVSPMELLQTRRLLLAKQLLTETVLPISEVAHASGFASIRRFNDAFGRRYGIPPSRFRRDAGAATTAFADTAFTLRLGYRAPFDWAGMLEFLAARQTEGVEHVANDSYSRTVAIGAYRGWIAVRNDARKSTLLVTLSHSLTPALPALLGRLRNLFDLQARPDLIGTALASSPLLRQSVERNPGLRVPGAFDGFEIAVRAVLGQQVSVKAATTLAGRIAEKFGERIETPQPGLHLLMPTATQLAAAGTGRLAAEGVMPSRAASIVALAMAASEGLSLEPGRDPRAAMEELTRLQGIGSWTASYIAMRALRWTDAFPAEDAVIRRRLGAVSSSEAARLSEAWRPWRSYAAMHLWRMPD